MRRGLRPAQEGEQRRACSELHGNRDGIETLIATETRYSGCKKSPGGCDVNI